MLKSLVEELQKYVLAGYLYIPVKEEQHKLWRELSDSWKELKKRNEMIVPEYRQGISVEALATHYHFSVYAILATSSCKHIFYFCALQKNKKV